MGLISLTKPKDSKVYELLARPMDFRHPTGSLKSGCPSGFVVTQDSAELGDSRNFSIAKEGIRAMAHFPSWTTPYVTTLAPESPMALVSRQLGFYCLNLCKVIEVIDNSNRFGFVYGATSQHAECGEEIFVVSKLGNKTIYHIKSHSRPGHPLAWLGYPIVRNLQKKFMRDSCQAIQRYVVDKAKAH